MKLAIIGAAGQVGTTRDNTLAKGPGRDFAFVMRGANKPQTAAGGRALGWFTPILKKWSCYGYRR